MRPMQPATAATPAVAVSARPDPARGIGPDRAAATTPAPISAMKLTAKTSSAGNAPPTADPTISAAAATTAARRHAVARSRLGGIERRLDTTGREPPSRPGFSHLRQLGRHRCAPGAAVPPAGSRLRKPPAGRQIGAGRESWGGGGAVRGRSRPDGDRATEWPSRTQPMPELQVIAEIRRADRWVARRPRSGSRTARARQPRPRPGSAPGRADTGLTVLMRPPAPLASPPAARFGAASASSSAARARPGPVSR